MLGPRIGKFVKDKAGKVTKVNAFPGHNLPIGALGVFILWLGWYGFNGAAATSVEELGSIFVTTTIAPAIATVVTMILTWVKYGKPDVSMCLNASLAGLVAITACLLYTSPSVSRRNGKPGRKEKSFASNEIRKDFNPSLFSSPVSVHSSLSLPGGNACLLYTSRCV